ncbi:hypothetical protein [Massilia sp. YMA4]|uniref:hypothetical protein n=1 Tax=Massilia sp. YMA4 TaxID=1593482 RepID=UPI0018787F47|nr:hypothetical protein [Massilia sp. YMA4]
MKRLLLASLLCFTCATAPLASAADASAPSEAVSEVTGSVVAGSLLTVAVGGSLVVASVQAVGEGLELLLKNVVDGSTATVRLSGKAAKGLSVAAGTAVQVVATGTGHVLMASGKALAFIPNEAGKALIRSGKAS